MKIGIVTYTPSPYQVELFNALVARGADLEVVYLERQCVGRLWKVRKLAHRGLFLERRRDCWREAGRTLSECDLVVFNYYRDPRAQALMNHHARTSIPWVFWGERPGFQVRPFIGRVFRLWALRCVHRNPRVAIWGIGSLAVEAYQREFGEKRDYRNVPYVSNLQRFDVRRVSRIGTQRVILFSGSLSLRKGIDVLAEAFCRVYRTHQNLRLRIVGDGELGEKVRDMLISVASAVEFVGFRDWDDLPAEYAKADFLCVPSRYDGWGLVVPEGLSASLPVIASDKTGSAVELITDGVNGWVIGAGSVCQLADSLVRCATMRDEDYKSMARTALSSVADRGLASGVRCFLTAAEAAVGSAW